MWHTRVPSVRIWGRVIERLGNVHAVRDGKAKLVSARAVILSAVMSKCQSMYYYAQTKDEGEGTVYTYENIWDAHKMYGCNCDDQYDGYDCALRLCPSGDDPMTGNGADTAANPVQYNDQQQVSCKAGGGTFTLAFRGKPLWRSITMLMSRLLQRHWRIYLPVVLDMNVLLTNAQACTESGSASTSFTVEFLQDFGSLPLMVADSSNLYNLNSISGDASLSVASRLTAQRRTHNAVLVACVTPLQGIARAIPIMTQVMAMLSQVHGDCGYATATIAVCPGAVFAVDMANVRNHPHTNAHAVMDGQAVTAAKGLVPRMSPGLPFLRLMMKRTLVKTWNVPIWELVIVIRARAHVIPALLVVRANISPALVTPTYAMATGNVWI